MHLLGFCELVVLDFLDGFAQIDRHIPGLRVLVWPTVPCWYGAPVSGDNPKLSRRSSGIPILTTLSLMVPLYMLHLFYGRLSGIDEEAFLT